MPEIIGRIPDSKYRTGLHGGMSLEKRFEAAKEWALKNTPVSDEEYSAIHQLMISEPNIDNLYGIAERAKVRHTPAIDPKLRAEWTEISRLSHQHNKIIRELHEEWKRWRFQAGTDWRHRLLRSPDALPELTLIDTNQDASVHYPNIFDARQRAKEIHGLIKQAEGIAQRYYNAMSFDTLPPAEQSIHLVHAAFDDIIELANRVSQLSAEVSALRKELRARKLVLKPRNLERNPNHACT